MQSEINLFNFYNEHFMAELNLPAYPAKITIRDGKRNIFDPLRRKYVALTPEEWVRQHFINFLITHKGYPGTLLGNEIAISLNGTSKRCDSILFDRQGHPLMIMEYKAPTVKITSKVFDQIARYNIVLKVRFLIVTNGMEHYCCKVDYQNNRCVFLQDIPHYEELNHL